MKDIKNHDLTPKESKKKGEAKEILTERTSLFWISQLLNVKKRTARQIIAEVAHKEPVISLSTQKGYRIARTEADVEDALHMVKDLDSRILQLEKRKKPLLKFVNAYMLDKGIANSVMLEQMFPLVEIKNHYTEEYNCRG